MLFASHNNRHDTVVALKDQVMQIGGGDRPQCWEFGRSIGIAEDVEGPNPHGSAAQVRVVETVPEECLQGNGRDTCRRSYSPLSKQPRLSSSAPYSRTCKVARGGADFTRKKLCG